MTGCVLANRPANGDEVSGGTTASRPVTHGPVVPYLTCADHRLGCDVAADLGLLRRSWIWREVQTGLSRETMDLARAHTGLGMHAPKLRVERPHSDQPLQAEDHATVDRDSPASEAGAASAGHDRDVVAVTPAHHPGNFVG